MKLLTSIVLPDEAARNARAIARGERQKQEELDAIMFAQGYTLDCGVYIKKQPIDKSDREE